jgi:hypothetical protein
LRSHELGHIIDPVEMWNTRVQVELILAEAVRTTAAPSAIVV